MEGSSKRKVMPPREQRLEWFISTFKNRDMLLAEDDEDTDYEPDGSHSMTFRDFASLELDLFESQVSMSSLSPLNSCYTYYFFFYVISRFVLCFLFFSLYTD